MEPLDFWRLLSGALGWMVAHSFWQITLLYLVYRLFAWRFGQHNRLLYAAVLLCMAAAALWAALSFETAWMREVRLAALEDTAVQLPAVPAELSNQHGAAGIWAPERAEPLYRYFERLYARWAVPVGWLWSLGVLVFSLRLWGGYWLSRRLRTVGVTPVPEHWRAYCAGWCFYLGIRRPVQWLESGRVPGPLTLGFWKPVVLFPAGLLLQLPPEQAEALLLHELAHIRRYDYVVNLFQLALEVCFFYHPLFWILSQEARRQREYCCDDVVLQYASNPLQYAQALTIVQLSFAHTQNHFAMQAIGKSAFAQRILRIAGLRPEKGHHSPVLLLFFLLALPGAGLLWPAFAPAVQPKPTTLCIALPEKTPARQPRSTAAAALPAPVSPTGPKIALAASPDTAAPAPLAIELNKMNVFYIGLDNPITVVAPGYDCAALQLRLEGPGEITPQGNCAYLVRARAPGEIRIRIYSMEAGREQFLGVKTFRAKRIPDPVALLEGFASSTISKTDLPDVLNRKLQAMLTNFDYDANCEIVSFLVTGIPPDAKNTDILEFAIQGNRIPANRQEYLNSLPAGTRIYFTNIKVRCPGDMYARVIGDLVIRVVE